MRYIHPIKNDLKLQLKHYQRQAEGTTPSGVRMQHIESAKPFIHTDFKQGILAEVPTPKGVQEMVFFGSYEDVNNVVAELKDNPEKVFSQIRPVDQATSNQFYLNKPAPSGSLFVEISPGEMEKLTAAQKLYPNQGRESQPTTRRQEETRELKAHMAKVAPEEQASPIPPGQTLVTAPPAANPPAEAEL